MRRQAGRRVAAGASRGNGAQAAPQGRTQRQSGPHVGRSDPGVMSAAARLAELGAIVALGYRRTLQKRLAQGAEGEAPCDRTVDGGETAEEVA